MIGYLTPHNATAEEHALYRSYQCGLCHVLGEEYGFHYRIFAGPDLVFFNIFADLFAQREARLGQRSCVLNPLGKRGRSLPMRERTDHTTLTAAFGVYMGVEKLRDNLEDDGGFLRWVLWRGLLPGWRKARQVLLDAGFPIEDVEENMAAQSRIEQGGALPLEDAARPTRSIASILFSHPSSDPLAAQIGERVGNFLFYMDNVLDFHRDTHSRSYNALARRFVLRGPQADFPAEARAAGLSGAQEQVSALRSMAAQLPLSAAGRFVRKVLVRGFDEKLQRLTETEGRDMHRVELHHLQPPRNRLLQQLRYGRQGLQAMAAFWVLFFMPRSAHAARWLNDAISDMGLAGAAQALQPQAIIPEAICCAMMCDDAASGCNPDCGIDCDPCGGLTC